MFRYQETQKVTKIKTDHKDHKIFQNKTKTQHTANNTNIKNIIKRHKIPQNTTKHFKYKK